MPLETLLETQSPEKESSSPYDLRQNAPTSCNHRFTELQKPQLEGHFVLLSYFANLEIKSFLKKKRKKKKLNPKEEKGFG